MIGILILSHDRLGESLLQCAGHVLGKVPEKVIQIGVSATDNPETILVSARDAIRLIDSGDGVLIMVDILGATPSNIASRLLQPGRVEGLSGASVPMLLRALTYRHESLSTVMAKATSGGHDGISNLP